MDLNTAMFFIALISLGVMVVGLIVAIATLLVEIHNKPDEM